MRQTIRPPGKGCPNGFWHRHDWRYGSWWNGNNRDVLPWWSGTRGLARPGWRCFECGKFAWDQSDIEFSVTTAFYLGLVKLPEGPCI